MEANGDLRGDLRGDLHDDLHGDLRDDPRDDLDYLKRNIKPFFMKGNSYIFKHIVILEKKN